MAKKDIKFTLDTIDSRYSPVGTVKQLDSVFFYIKITENGVTKDLTGQTIKLFAIKEDKKIVEQTTKINITNQREGLVEIELLNAAIQVHGFTYFELEISDSNGIISTSDFILIVNKRVGSDEAIESTNEVAILKKIEEYVAQAKVELQKFKELQTEMLKTNEIINDQETERANAESARGKAELIREEKIEKFGLQVTKMADDYNKALANVTNGNESVTNSEVVQARGKHVNLGARLDEKDLRLSKIETNIDEFKNLVEKDDWTKAIRKAVEKAGVGGAIKLNKNTTYTISGQINLLLNQMILGYGATLKRANESVATLLTPANNNDTNITVNKVPSDWEIGDTIHLFTGNKGIESTDTRTIVNIDGNTIKLDKRIGNLINSKTENSYQVGTGVRKVFTMLAGQQYPIPFNNIIKGLTFDGNKENNSSNYFWNHNNTLHVYGHNAKVTDCKFINIPNENIVTHGSLIDDNYAKSLNGSFVHLSSPPAELGEDITGCNITNNYVKYSNIIPDSIGLHSRTVIEQSWNAGKVVVESNYFEGVGNDYCLDIIEPTEIDNSKKYYEDIKYINNTFKNYKGIARNVNSYISWDINEKIIAENIFNNCGYNDFSNLPNKNVLFLNNLLTNGTAIKGYKNIIKGDLILDNGISIKNSKGNILGLYNTEDDYITLQRAGVKYLKISPENIFSLNAETKIENSFDGIIKINEFERFLINDSDSILGTSALNSTYPYPAVSIGSEVFFPNISTPAIAKRVSPNKWRWISTSL